MIPNQSFIIRLACFVLQCADKKVEWNLYLLDECK